MKLAVLIFSEILLGAAIYILLGWSYGLMLKGTFDGILGAAAEITLAIIGFGCALWVAYVYFVSEVIS